MNNADNMVPSVNYRAEKAADYQKQLIRKKKKINVSKAHYLDGETEKTVSTSQLICKKKLAKFLVPKAFRQTQN